ncbi:hypothetical protein KP509_20G040800 [Ceratopteris richardii]|nr:hypothetical protein KP509_20G040800 [Ceratopteris richardii]
MFVECKGLSHAERVFEKLVDGDEFSWTSLLSAKSECARLEDAITLYERMQEEDIHPSCQTFVTLLKCCAKEKDINVGMKVHLEAINMGLNDDTYVSSALIDLYCKCGALSEAQDILNEIPVRGVVPWTTLMAGYVDHGSCHEALECFDKMQNEDQVVPDEFSFASSLKACGHEGCLERGRDVHLKLTKVGYERDAYIGSSLISMYAKCNSPREAQKVFDSLPVQNIVVWNALLSGYAEHAHVKEALTCFKEMKMNGIVPDAVALACTLKCCGDANAVDEGRALHTLVRQQRLEGHPAIASSLVAFYTRHGSHGEALEVFEKVEIKDVMIWTSLISGYVEHGFNLEALEAYERMQKHHVSPDAFTLACIVKACNNLGNMKILHGLHMQALKAGLDGDMFVVSALVNAYAKHACVVDSYEILNKVPKRDIVSWNSLFTGIVEGDAIEEVFEFLDVMLSEGMTLDNVTYACIIKACGNLGSISKGRRYNTEIAAKGLDNDTSIAGSLISMYAKCGALVDAREIFDRMPMQSPVIWSLMIQGYALNHEGGMVIEFFEEMQKAGIQPDAVIFTCLLAACSHASLVFEGKRYFSQMREKFGISPADEHYTCMVDLLGRSGHLIEAEKFLDMIPHVSEGTWAALLCACKTHLEPELGWRCLEQLVQKIPEDATWYVLMADILANTGRLNELYKLEVLRKHVGAKKKPATARIEVNGKVHEFVAHEESSKEISSLLRSLTLRARAEGYLPNLDSDFEPDTDETKAIALCEHAEKFAIAFGILNTPQGATLRVTKNLRMCNDCHNASKVIAKLENREIIIRDDSCIHHFKGGLCSCGDMF